MNHHLKALGLVLASVFTMGAISASAASAAEFHASTAPIGVTGTQTTGHVFTTNAFTITCKVATFSGTQAAKTTSTAHTGAELRSVHRVRLHQRADPRERLRL